MTCNHHNGRKLVKISIHTLHTESDTGVTQSGAAALAFQSTLSIQRVTRYIDIHSFNIFYFNPHSPYREWLATSTAYGLARYNFNPHSPYREWLVGRWRVILGVNLFQSTLSIQRVTSTINETVLQEANISIHTLHTESDLTFNFTMSYAKAFQSTLSIQRVTNDTRLTIFNRLDFNPHSQYREWLQKMIKK